MDTSSQVAALRSEKGMVIVYVALLISVLLGFLGLAVDTGHLFKVQNELQNAADAAALKGAYFLYTKPANPTQAPELQWNVALAKAKEMIPGNTSDNKALPDATATVGYWNLVTHVMQGQGISPTINDIPAVQVIVSRATGSNGGPVGNFFMQILDTDNSTTAVSSRPAIAMVGYPGSVSSGDASAKVFPLAISKDLTDKYFSQVPLPEPAPAVSLGYGSHQLTIGGISYRTGQWTSFLDTQDSASAIRGLINNGNPEPLAVGDRINIAPGAKAALYNGNNADWLPTPEGKDVILPIVDNGIGDFTSQTPMSITGFATFHLDSVSGGSDKYVTGHFVNYFTSPTGFRPGGGLSNTVTRPIMAQ